MAKEWLRKGFTGLGRDGPVLIVAPLGVVPLVSLIRAHLIEVAKAKLSREQRARIATALLDHITSPVFRVPLEEAMAKTRRAQEVLVKEIRDHFGVWQERSQLYQTIAWDVNHINNNVGRVLEGMKPLPLVKSKPEPLRLPAVGKGRQIEFKPK